MNPENIEEMVESLKRDGPIEKASANFSINPMSALAKMGNFQLPRPHSWILKLLQFAVALSAESFCVESDKEKVLIRIGSPRLPEGDFVEEFFSDLSLSSGKPAAHIQAAVRVLVGRGVAVSMRPPGKQVGLEFSSDGFREQPVSEVADNEALVISLTGAVQIGKLREELERYGHLAPLRVQVGETRVDCFDRDERTILESQTHGEDILGFWEKAGDGVPGFGLPRPDMTQEWASSLSAGETAESWTKSRFTMAALLEISEKKGASKIHWLKDGVMIEEEVLAKLPGLEVNIYLNANDLKTDLSGFQLQQNENKKERRVDGLKQLRNRIEQAQSQTSKRKREVQEGASPPEKKASKILLASLVPPAVLVLLVVLGVSLDNNRGIGFYAARWFESLANGPWGLLSLVCVIAVFNWGTVHKFLTNFFQASDRKKTSPYENAGDSLAKLMRGLDRELKDC